MLHATSFARQAKLAADYREQDVRQAMRDRAAAETGGSGTADVERPPTPHGVPSPIARLRTLLPHAH
jgi:hypothetical protein